MPCTPGSARQLAGERRAGGAAAAHGSGRACHHFCACRPALEREKAAAPQRDALRHPPTPPRKAVPRSGKFATQSVSLTKFSDVGHLLRRGNAVLSQPAGWEEKFSGHGAQAGPGDPPWLPRAGRDGARSSEPDRGLRDRHRPCRALPLLPSTPGRTATSPTPAISSPCQHVRIPGARSRAPTASRLASSFPRHVPRHPKSLRGPRWALGPGLSAPGRAARVHGVVPQLLPAAGALALTCVLQGQAAFLLGAPVLGTLRRVGGVGPPRQVEGGQYQSQGHELAQPLSTHGSWCKPPVRRPGFFVFPSSSSSSLAASPPPPTLPPRSPFPSSSRPQLG